MEEQKLTKICLIAAIFGLFMLFVLVNEIDINDAALNAVQKDSYVTVSGKVSSIKEYEGRTMLTIQQENTLRIVAFTPDYLSIKNGSIIEAIGEVKTYNGELEMIADEVRVVG